MELRICEPRPCCRLVGSPRMHRDPWKRLRAPSMIAMGASTPSITAIRVECRKIYSDGVLQCRNMEHCRKWRGFGLTMVRSRDEGKRCSGTQIRLNLASNSLAEYPSSFDSSSLDVKSTDIGRRSELQGGGNSSQAVVKADGEEELEKGYTMNRICDRLIEVFMMEKTTPQQWRNLLALSEEWIRIRPHFFERCKKIAKAEANPQKRRDLVYLAEKVKEVDDGMIRHDALLAEIEQDEFGIDLVVAKRRKDFSGGFFEHLRILCDVSPRLSRQDEIASIAGKCLSVIEAYDAALEDLEAIGDAQLKFDDILTSSSLEDASNKIKALARRKELDSTLLLLITKAWARAKDSTTMKQEVKILMLYLYREAKDSMLKLVPDEVRILKYLLSIPDPRDRFAAMAQSFSPGDELEEKNENRLHTKPDKLRYWIKLILDAYHQNRQNTLMKEAQSLTNPQVISRLEMLLEYMNDQFM